MTSNAPAKTAARTAIAVQGARVHNLKNISVEIPRDRLIVVRISGDRVGHPVAEAAPPQNRTCGFPAYGSSERGCLQPNVQP
jgi:hypothetical protein